ncbi:hypothetical protein FLGE108171_13805 [Flavobacterium gelidilacus]|uniref:hypothetical protein n=1 Tax=Flavobacterium gelidilacus TaxID=206041 RepID=UPI000479B674|nr:hypothetical protein [Flavobacterium gelidilacus]
MKKLVLLFFLGLILNSCKASYPKYSMDAVSLAEKQRVYNFGEKIAKTCIAREFVQLSKQEVTQSLSELTLEEMQRSCDVLDKRNGKFIDMKLIEIIDDTFLRKNLIYRYKANFERNDYLNEIRIWVKTDGKFAGIIYRKWNDNFIP